MKCFHPYHRSPYHCPVSSHRSCRILVMCLSSRPRCLCVGRSSFGSWLVVGISRWWWLFSCMVVAVSVCGRPFMFILRHLLSFEWLCLFWGIHCCLSGHVHCWAVVATGWSWVVVGIGRFTAGGCHLTIVGAIVCW